MTERVAERSAEIQARVNETLNGPGRAEQWTGGWRLAARHAKDSEWLLARVSSLETALAEARGDFDLIQRTIRNSRHAPNVFESLADFAKWGEERVDAALTKEASS